MSTTRRWRTGTGLAGQIEIANSTEDDLAAIEELLLAVAKAMPAGQSRYVVIRQPFAIHVYNAPKKSAADLLKVGEYALLIRRTAKHPKVRFPTDLIPETVKFPNFNGRGFATC